MSARAHIGTADKGVFTKCYLQEVPRVGEIIRTAPDIYWEVVDVCWCLDESSYPDWMRVNITVKPEGEKK